MRCLCAVVVFHDVFVDYCVRLFCCFVVCMQFGALCLDLCLCWFPFGVSGSVLRVFCVVPWFGVPFWHRFCWCMCLLFGSWFGFFCLVLDFCSMCRFPRVVPCWGLFVSLLMLVSCFVWLC